MIMIIVVKQDHEASCSTTDYINAGLIKMFGKRNYQDVGKDVQSFISDLVQTSKFQ